MGRPGNGKGFDEGGEFQSPSLERLVRSLNRLPGLGRKSATRLALHLVARAEGAAVPAEELVAAIADIEALESIAGEVTRIRVESLG